MTQPIAEINYVPKVHLRKLYEFKNFVKSNYLGEDMMFLLARTNTKIIEVKAKINE